MIFKRLFRPKYQDPNPQVRLQVIDNLNAQDAKQKQQLHELAFNDASTKVSLAALEKLNLFALWVKTAQHGQSEPLRKAAQSKVEQQVLQPPMDSEKQAYLLACNKQSLIEKWLIQQGAANAQLATLLLEKPHKLQWVRQFIFKLPELAQQQVLLAQIDDIADLQRVIRKSPHPELVRAAQQKIDAQQEAARLPADTRQQASMLLSRLLALRELTDVGKVQAQQKSLSEAYLALPLTCLSQAKQDEFSAKFTDIQQKIQASIEKHQAQYHQQQQWLAEQQRLQAIVKDAESCLNKVAAGLQQDNLDEASQQQWLTLLAAQLLAVQGAAEAMPETATEAKSDSQRQLNLLRQRLLACQASVEKRPAFLQAQQQAADLLQALQALPLPSDPSQIEAAEAHLHDVKQQWRDIQGDFSADWPAEQQQQWQQLLKAWKDACHNVRQQLQQQIKSCRNQLNRVTALIEQGRYRAALGLFGKAQKTYQRLLQAEQQKVASQYQRVSQQVEELQDWQAYIAAPRKPALLAEAEQLAAQPLSIKAQQKQVTLLRKQWQSLGQLDSEADQALDQAFEVALEQAYAPCRAHFAEQQKKRAANLQQKQAVLQQLAGLSAKGQPVASWYKDFQKLQQAWRNIGEVDHQVLAELSQAYQQQCAPLKSALHNFYQQNSEQKEKLVQRAQHLLKMDVLTEAIEQAKQLQQQWRTVASAGRKQDEALWQAFREANDALFTRRDQQQQQHKAQVADLRGQLDGLLQEMHFALQQADDHAAVQRALDKQDDLQALLAQLPEKIQQSGQRQWQDLQQQQQDKFTALRVQQEQAQYQALFAVLKQWKPATSLPEQWASLPNQWQQAFNMPETAGYNRQQLTLMLEILHNVDSPDSDASLRRDVQLQMLANKLQQGQLDARQVLKDWIACGPVSDAEQQLLARVESIFTD